MTTDLRERLIARLLKEGVSLDGEPSGGCKHVGCKEHLLVYDCYIDHRQELLFPIVEEIGDLIPVGLRVAAMRVIDDRLEGVFGLHPRRLRENAGVIADAVMEVVFGP